MMATGKDGGKIVNSEILKGQIFGQLLHLPTSPRGVTFWKTNTGICRYIFIR